MNQQTDPKLLPWVNPSDEDKLTVSLWGIHVSGSEAKAMFERIIKKEVQKILEEEKKRELNETIDFVDRIDTEHKELRDFLLENKEITEDDII